MASTITSLMHSLRSDDPTAPRLTWYGPAGERVELSGRVLDNWVAKTASFLAEELDAGPGTTVRLDLPAHWRSLCWSLATWLTGAALDFGPAHSGRQPGLDTDRRPAPDAGVDAGHGAAAAGRATPGGALPAVVATDDPDSSPAAELTVAVALGALDMRWRGDLPPGVVDYAAEVRAFPDVFFAVAEPEPTDVAVVHPQGDFDGDVSFAHLLDGYATPVAGPQRVLLRAGSAQQAVREALGIWAAGGSVVLVHPDVQVTERLVESEKVTRS